jgi:hypothetical protein
MKGSAGSYRLLHPNSTPERQAQDARARAWAFVLECWHNKKGDHYVVTTSKPSNAGNGITNNGTGDD